MAAMYPSATSCFHGGHAGDGAFAVEADVGHVEPGGRVEAEDVATLGGDEREVVEGIAGGAATLDAPAVVDGIAEIVTDRR